MVTQAKKIRAGVFVTVGLSLIVVAVAVVAGLRLLERHTVYHVEFSGSVGGLTPGTTVTYKGVPVGEVKDIRFFPEDIERILVALAVDPGTPIKTDTRATMRVTGLTGATLLELYGGTNSAERLPPHETIAADRPLLEALTYDAPQVLENFQALLADLRGITSATNRERISNVLAGAERFFGTGAESLVAAAGDLRSMAEELRQTTPRIESLIDRLDTTLTSVGDSLTAGAAAFRSTAERMQQATSEVDVEGIGRDLRAASQNLRTWTEGDDPTSLLSEVRVTIEETRALLTDLREIAGTNGEVVSRALLNLQESTLVLQDFLKIVRSNPGVLLAPPRPDH